MGSRMRGTLNRFTNIKIRFQNMAHRFATVNGANNMMMRTDDAPLHLLNYENNGGQVRMG